MRQIEEAWLNRKARSPVIMSFANFFRCILNWLFEWAFSNQRFNTNIVKPWTIISILRTFQTKDADLNFRGLFWFSPGNFTLNGWIVSYSILLAESLSTINDCKVVVIGCFFHEAVIGNSLYYWGYPERWQKIRFLRQRIIAGGWATSGLSSSGYSES